MNKYYRPRYFLALITATLLVCVAGSSLLSCNSRVHLNLSNLQESSAKPNASTTTLASDMNIKIEIAHFFVQYLEDLLGIEGIEGLVQKIELQAYLDSLPSVTNVKIRTQSHTLSSPTQDSFSVYFRTNDLLATLSELNILFTTNTTSSTKTISLAISRSFITSFINNFPELNSIDLVSMFLPDPKTVAEDRFAKYIGWSFSEYQSESTVEQSLEASTIQFVIEKEANLLAQAIDAGWTSVVKNNTQGGTKHVAQEIFFDFVPLLYTDYKELTFTY